MMVAPIAVVVVCRSMAASYAGLAEPFGPSMALSSRARRASYTSAHVSALSLADVHCRFRSSSMNRLFSVCARSFVRMTDTSWNDGRMPDPSRASFLPVYTPVYLRAVSRFA